MQVCKYTQVNLLKISVSRISTPPRTMYSGISAKQLALTFAPFAILATFASVSPRARVELRNWKSKALSMSSRKSR